MNILITAAATAQAYQIERLIRGTGTVFFADSADLPQFMLKKANLIKISAGDSPAFAHELLTICLDQQIGKVYPLRKEEIKALAEARTLFSEYGIQLMVPPLDKIKTLEMKSRPGKIQISEDAGVFLMDIESPENGIAIFTAD